MEFSGTDIRRITSKLKLVVFCYFPVSRCKNGNGCSFDTHMYKEIVQNSNWFFFFTCLRLFVKKRVDGVSGHIYTKK